MFPLIHRTTDAISYGIGKFFLALIWVYQKCISPWLGANCRFTPTCSAYACQAIRKYGPFVGVWMAIKRICRCHPGCPGGYDPVP